MRHKMDAQIKIIIAPAPFKGSLSNIQAARIMEKAVLSIFPRSEIIKFPLADGGEGTIDAVKKISGGTFRHEEIHGPLFKKRKAAWLKKGSTAFIEMARASGLTLLENEEKNPLKTTTFGTGELLARAASAGCRRIFVGAGGSATNDAGIGALTALGIKFRGKNGKIVYPGTGFDLAEIKSIDNSGILPEILRCKITMLSDVENRLFGKKGAAFIYAPQKGANEKAVELLDRGLRNFAETVKKLYGREISSLRGGGAAGGIVAGLASFLDTEILSGADTLMEMGKFESRLESADILLTGEGRIDEQTGYGKSLKKVFKLAEKHGVKTIALAGGIENPVYKKEFKNVVFASILPGPSSVEEAMKHAKRNLYNTTVQMLRLHKISRSIRVMEREKGRKHAGKS